MHCCTSTAARFSASKANVLRFSENGNLFHVKSDAAIWLDKYWRCRASVVSTGRASMWRRTVHQQKTLLRRPRRLCRSVGRRRPMSWVLLGFFLSFLFVSISGDVLSCQKDSDRFLFGRTRLVRRVRTGFGNIACVSHEFYKMLLSMTQNCCMVSNCVLWMAREFLWIKGMIPKHLIFGRSYLCFQCLMILNRCYCKLLVTQWSVPLPTGRPTKSGFVLAFSNEVKINIVRFLGSVKYSHGDFGCYEK